MYNPIPEIMAGPASRRSTKRTVAARTADGEIHRDVLNLDDSKARDKFVQATMRGLCPGILSKDWPRNVSDALAQRLLDLAAAPVELEQPSLSDVADVYEDPRGAALEAMDPDVRAQAERLLEDPNLLHRIHDHFEVLGVVGESCLRLLTYFVGVSAQLSNPLAAIIRGLTASGKSYVVSRVSSLFPPEVVLRATDITTNALYYFDAGQLHHRFVVAGERSRKEDDDRAEATRALREMIEGGELSKAVPIKDGEKIRTVTIHQQGPIAYIETTTLTDIFPEDANRCLLLATDESEAQTRRVLHATAYAAAGHRLGNVSRVVAIHHAIQRMLPRVEVIVPFAEAIAELYPLTDDARRRYKQLLHLTMACALLHYRQRQSDPEGRIIADCRDYQIAARLARGPLEIAHGGISASARRLYDALRHPPRLEFTAADLASDKLGSKTMIAARLKELASRDFIEQTEPPRGNMPARWIVRKNNHLPTPGGIPSIEQLAAQLAKAERSQSS